MLRNSVLQLLINNSSLIALPGVNFISFLIIARSSQLPEDTLFFFLSALFGLFTLLDGGLPYKVKAGNGRGIGGKRSIRRILVNYCRFVPFLLPLSYLLISTSPFGASHSWSIILYFSLLSAFICIVKIQGDAMRLLGFKSDRRILFDRASSILAIVRVMVLWIFVGKVNYLSVFAGLLLAESFVYARLLQWPLFLPFVLRRSVFKGRLFVYKDFLLANIAYIVSSNIDRLIGYYVLNTLSYNVLVGFSSVFNMAILPHKLVENELTFPSRTDTRREAIDFLAYLLAVAGATGLVIGVSLLSSKIGGRQIGDIGIAMALIWLALTLQYNMVWAHALRDAAIREISARTVLAGAASLVGALLLKVGYGHFILVGLMTYGVMNYIGVALLGRVRLHLAVVYPCLVLLGGGIGHLIDVWWLK